MSLACSLALAAAAAFSEAPPAKAACTKEAPTSGTTWAPL